MKTVLKRDHCNGGSAVGERLLLKTTAEWARVMIPKVEDEGIDQISRVIRHQG